MTEKLLEVLLKFSLDKNSTRAAEKEFGSVEKALAEINDEALTVAATMEGALGRALDDLDKKAKKTTTSINKMRASASRLGESSRFALGAGVGIAGSVFGSAKLFIDELEEAGDLGDEAAQRWVNATGRIEDSFKDVGSIAVSTVLPVLEKAAELAEKTADFVEENPEVVRTALNTGLALATIGAVGLAVSKGIKLVADVKTVLAAANNLLAAKIMEAAASKNLAASLAATKAGGVATIVTPASIKSVVVGAATKIGGALVLALATYIGAQGGVALGNAINRELLGEDFVEQDAKDAFETFKKLVASSLGVLLITLESIGLVSDETSEKMFEVVKSLTGLGDKSEDISSGADKPEASSAVQKEAKELYENQLKLADKYNSDLAKIAKDSAKKIESANSSLRNALRNAAQTLQNSLRNINTRFATQSKKAEIDYQEDRFKIVRDGNEDIQQIEQDHQDNLRKMLLEHDIRVEDLVANRDALGLAREQRRFEQQRQEAENEVGEQIRERNAEIAKRLADQARAFAIERAHRIAQFVIDVKEANLRNKQTVDRARLQHKERIENIKKEGIEKRQELAASYNKERIELLKSRSVQLQDLASALNAERTLKRQAYIAMNEDLRAATAVLMKGAAKSGSQLKSRAEGGYASFGNYTLGDAPGGRPGGEEFVLNNKATKAAEQAIGGRLNQQKITNAIRGNSNTVQLTLPGGVVTMSTVRELFRANNDNIANELADVLEFN